MVPIEGGDTAVVSAVIEYVWLLGVVGAAGLLMYGGWCVLHFELSASVASKRAVARLALHESAPQHESLAEVKTAAMRKAA